MSDLIRRSDVMDKVEVINWYHVNADGKLVSGAAEEVDAFIHYSDAVEAIEKAPAVDAVEVVRCRECRWCHAGFCELHDDIIPWGAAHTRWRDWYCADGQRREDGDNT